MTPDPCPKARILVVDDESTTRSAVARALSLLGYQTHAAGSGSEALSELATHEYDLMLLDVRMPGMDGMEVLAQARQSYPDLVVILLTAQVTPASAVEAARAGAAGHLLKPCSLEEIEEAITGALKRHREGAVQSEHAAAFENCVHSAALRDSIHSAALRDSIHSAALQDFVQ